MTFAEELKKDSPVSLLDGWEIVQNEDGSTILQKKTVQSVSVEGLEKQLSNLRKELISMYQDVIPEYQRQIKLIEGMLSAVEVETKKQPHE